MPEICTQERVVDVQESWRHRSQTYQYAREREAWRPVRRRSIYADVCVAMSGKKADVWPIDQQDVIVFGWDTTKGTSAQEDSGIEAEFKSLLNTWKTQTKFESNLNKIVLNPAYQRIIGMGAKAVPYIIEELQRRPGHWFWALNAITGLDAATPGDTVAQATQKWVAWGKENDYIR